MIGIITATYKKQTLELFCESINRLRSECDVSIPCICVGEREDEALCNKYHITHIYHPNTFVSNKFSLAMTSMRAYSPSHVMILGSDDVMSVDMFREYLRLSEDDSIDLIQPTTIHVYHAYEKRLIRLDLENIGAGRCYHSRILDSHQWDIWKFDKNKNLDYNSFQAVKDDISKIERVSGVLTDIKTNNNITRWTGLIHHEQCRNTNPSVFYDTLSEKQLELLNNINPI